MIFDIFDRGGWAELVMIADDIEATTQMLLCEYSNHFDSRGRATTKPKLLARAVGVSEAEVRKHLSLAKNAGWLEAVQIEGRKGYQAIMP